jgi:hypothetical protein
MNEGLHSSPGRNPQRPRRSGSQLPGRGFVLGSSLRERRSVHVLAPESTAKRSLGLSGKRPMQLRSCAQEGELALAHLLAYWTRQPRRCLSWRVRARCFIGQPPLASFD